MTDLYEGLQNPDPNIVVGPILHLLEQLIAGE